MLQKWHCHFCNIIFSGAGVEMRVWLFAHIFGVILSYLTFFAASLVAGLYIWQDYALKHKAGGRAYFSLPDLSLLDRWNYRLVGFGFCALSAALAAGFVYRGVVYSCYWAWNLRTEAALLLWFAYALILYARLSSRWRGRKIAWLSLSCFVVVLASLFGSCRLD